MGGVWYGPGGWWGGAHGRDLGSKAPTRSILELPVRATTLLNRLLGLPGTAVIDPGSWQVAVGGGEVCVRL